MRELLTSLLLLAGGCVIVLDTTEPEPVDPPTQPPSQARQAFERDVYPTLVANCASCHAADPKSPSGYAFVVPGNVDKSHEAVMSVVLLSEPDASRLLTKGIHAGPGFTPEQANRILKWLDLEASGF